MRRPHAASVELVITAPPPFGAALAYRTRCRMTLGVLTQLMSQAQEYVVIAAPFLQAGYGLSGGPLSMALRAALTRGINVDIVSTGQSLRTLNVSELSTPAQGQLGFFQPKANIDTSLLGCHAKFCIADGEAAYVGSANITGPGLSEQLEMGVLVTGEVARHIAEFWSYCVEIGLFMRVSPPV